MKQIKPEVLYYNQIHESSCGVVSFRGYVHWQLFEIIAFAKALKREGKPKPKFRPVYKEAS